MMPDDQLKQFSPQEIAVAVRLPARQAQVPMLATKDNRRPVLQRPGPDRLDGDEAVVGRERRDRRPQPGARRTTRS